MVQKIRHKPFVIDNNDKAGAGIRGVLVAIMAVLGLNLVPSLYKNMALPRIVPMDLDQAYKELPILKLIKEQSPKDFKLMIAPVDRAVRNKKMSQAVLDKFRKVYFELIAEKTKNASPDSLRELEKIIIQQHAVFKEKKPEICTLILNGEPYPSVADIVSPEEARMEQRAMLKLFTAAPRDAKFRSDLGKGEELFKEIISQATSDLKITNVRPVIADGFEGGLAKNEKNFLEHQKICDLATLISNRRIELNDNDFINVYDYIASIR